MPYIIPHYIGGQPVIDTTTMKLAVHNPALGQEIGHAYVASPAMCDQAVQTAQEAWPAWSETPAIKRATILFKFRELLEKNRMDLARIVTREHGKTLDDAQGSVARAMEVVEHYCGLLTQWQGTFSNNVSNQMDCYTFRQALGVCAGVSPFNFPVMVPVWMMLPAIACGNTFILKPSEQAPSAPIRLLELLTDAGLPAGVANLLQGDKSTVEQLIAHRDIAAITAVASTPVAEFIYTEATRSGKRSQTFGSAKNHAVVMPDADLDFTAKAIVGAAYGAAGERCMAISVVVVVGENTASLLLNKLMPLIKAIRVDAGDAAGCDMGPLISAPHRERVLAAIHQGVAEGATLLMDGRSFTHPHHPQGYFMGPSLFDHVTENMSLYTHEIFGPVLIVMRVPDVEEALNIVNRNQYGNGTAIFTRDGYTGREYAKRVHVGMVGINVPIPVPIASHAFGGWKRSSFGDTNMHGLEGLHFYTKRKTVTCRWPTVNMNEATFVMPSH